MSKSSRQKLHSLVRQIEDLLNEGPSRTANTNNTTRTGRVQYVAAAKAEEAKDQLPRRAQQALKIIERRKHATARDLQRGMRVNRNVIAGALHELRQAKVIRAEPIPA